jgi:Sulfotransferase family
MRSRRPILITGSHRSGTGWVGEMLAATPDPALAYIWEPFSLRARPGIRDAPFRYWFTYVCAENEAPFKGPLADTLAFRYRPLAELRSLRSPKDAGRFVRDWYVTGRHRRRDAVPVFKDPIAVFSAEWLADTFDMDVLVLIRHPAAFVSSIMKQAWDHPFGHFLAQPLMMRDELGPFEAEIRTYAGQPQPLMDQAILLWNVIHHQILQYRDRRPSWNFVLHEDLSREPLSGFKELYDRFGLRWTDAVAHTVEEHSGTGNPSVTTDAASHKRDSRKAITAWKARLTPEEVDRIRTRTDAISKAFYTDDDW